MSLNLLGANVSKDTIVGVLALAKTAFITKDVITNTNIEINYDAGTENMTLTRKSPLVPQKIQVFSFYSHFS